MRFSALAAVLAIPMCCPICVRAEKAQTVRHHRVVEAANTADYDKAQDAITKGDLAAARALLQKYTVESPQDYRGWYTLAYAESQLGDKETAIAAYRKALVLKPDLFEANLNLGLLLAQAGDKSGAAELLRKATVETPNAADESARKLAVASAWGALGRLQSGEEAKRSFEQALANDPQNEDAKARLANGNAVACPAGQVWARTGDAAGACVSAATLTSNELEQMLAKNPNDHAVASRLAHAYVENKEYAKAEPLLRQLVLKTPDDADENYRYAFVLMRLHRSQPAQQFLLRALQLKPEMKEAYGDLAIVAAENKDYALSLKALDARTKFLPESAATYFLRATDLDYLHDEMQAAVYYHKFLEISQGESPDSDWQAKHRLIAIDPKERKR